MNNSGQDTDFSSLSGVNEEWFDNHFFVKYISVCIENEIK